MAGLRSAPAAMSRMLSGLAYLANAARSPGNDWCPGQQLLRLLPRGLPTSFHVCGLKGIVGCGVWVEG